LHRFSENHIFTVADDYSLEIELPVGYFSHARQCPRKLALHSLNRKSAECPQNIAVFGHLTRKDVDTDKIFFNAVLQDTKFRKVGAVVITGITNESVKVQFLEKRSNSEAVFRFVRHEILFTRILAPRRGRCKTKRRERLSNLWFLRILQNVQIVVCQLFAKFAKNQDITKYLSVSQFWGVKLGVNFEFTPKR